MILRILPDVPHADDEREAQRSSHKPTLVAEAALMQAESGGAHDEPVRSFSGCPSSNGGSMAFTRKPEADDHLRRDGEGGVQSTGAALYGPANKYRMSVREPWRITADLRAKEREQDERVRESHKTRSRQILGYVYHCSVPSHISCEVKRIFVACGKFQHERVDHP